MFFHSARCGGLIEQKVIMKLYSVSLLSLLLCAAAPEGEKTESKAEGSETVKSIHDFTVQDIDGKEVSLADYKGKVLMIVNVASKCGFTGQYAGLQELYDTYKDKGFVILGFPANDFLGQEPGTNDEIKQFCTLNYGVSFPMFAKISVKGDEQHPLYKYLTDKKANPDFGGKITWNFNKFLVDANGKVIGRFGTRTAPKSKTVIEEIEKALKALE